MHSAVKATQYNGADVEIRHALEDQIDMAAHGRIRRIEQSEHVDSDRDGVCRMRRREPILQRG